MRRVARIGDAADPSSTTTRLPCSSELPAMPTLELLETLTPRAAHRDRSPSRRGPRLRRDRGPARVLGERHPKRVSRGLAAMRAQLQNRGGLMSDPVRELKQRASARPRIGRLTQTNRGHAASPCTFFWQLRHWRSSALLALVVTTPWASSPGFMERAEAALAPAGDSSITGWWRPRSPRTSAARSRGPDRDLDRPERRTGSAPFEPPIPSPDADERALVCSPGTAGSRSSEPRRRFAAAAPVRAAERGSLGTLPLLGIPFDPDFVTDLRTAIATGRAHHEGMTELDGRMVERIRLDSPRPPLLGPVGLRGRDPRPLSLVREEWPPDSP